MPRFVTLKHVAQEADVSVYSASRALNGLDGVSASTRERVIAAAASLGYVPNRAAQLLRRDERRTVGILTANSANVYYAKLVAGIEDVIRPLGFQTLATDAIDGGEYSLRREAEFVETMMELRVAAVVLTYRLHAENLDRLLERGLPVVFVDCTPPDAHPKLPSAMSDGEGISLEVGRHFAGHGYRSWAYLGHNVGWPTRQGRETGFRQAADECGATLNVVEGSNSIEAAYRSYADFLSTDAGRAVDALYASNEILLLGAVRAIREAGLTIGSDIGVIGFDDFDWAVAFDTPFTVVDQKIRGIGRHAGTLILDASGEKDLLQRHAMPDPHLVLRRSCGC